MTEVETLQSENKAIKEVLENTHAEKTAIDQVCLNNIKENIQLRTRIIMLEKHVYRLEQELIPHNMKITEQPCVEAETA